MKHVRIELGRLAKWTNRGQVWTSGTAFIGTELKSEESLCHYFQTCQTGEEFIRLIRNLNGFFAIVKRDDAQFFAAVDHVRSIPLFYSNCSSVFYLSDDPYWIQDQLGGTELDPVSIVEFLMAGYVTRFRTLDPRIMQLQAGEILLQNNTESQTEMRTELYYRFHHHDHYLDSIDDLCQRLDEVTISAVQRLLQKANGRQLVLPLSGGHDSRLLAMTIKRLGYDNVFAFSYGLLGNRESEISRQIAENLGIRWHFVPYTRKSWHDWHRFPEWGKYARFNERLVSVPHFQDWPAVMELLRSSHISDNALFVPGHSADYLAGKQIPSSLLKQCSHKARGKRTVKAVWQRHYNLQSMSSVSRLLGLEKGALLQALEARIRGHFTDFDLETNEEMVEAFDYEFWQEWLSKVIVNSMRVYEYWGCEWWLPYYDSEFVSFWEHVPLQYRLHKVLYDNYVSSVQQDFGVALGFYRTSPLKQWAMGIINRAGLWQLAYELYWRMYRRTHDYYGHPIGWYGIADYSTYFRLLKRGGSIYTLIAAEQMWKQLNNG